MTLDFHSLVAINLGLMIASLAIIYALVLSPLSSWLPIGVKFKARNYVVKFLVMGLHALFRRSFDVQLTDQIIDPKENALVFMNHQGIIDYFLIFHLASRVELFFFIHGYCVRFPTATVLYRSWRHKSNWIVPQRNLDKTFCELNRTPGPKWIVMFPEVKRWTSELCREHQVYCKYAGTAPLKTLLYPRFPSVIQGIDYLRTNVTAIYDLSVRYEPTSPPINILISPDKWSVEVSVRKFQISKIPRTAKRLERFIERLWYQKDKELSKNQKIN